MIELVVHKEYRFEIKVEARREAGKVRYHATVEGGALISHFDARADYVGKTVEQAVEAIAKALDEAIEAMRGV